MSSKPEYPYAYGDARSVLVIGDTPLRRTDLRSAVEALGGRVRDAVPVVGSAERLAAQTGLDAVIADIGSDPGEALDALLAEIQKAARRGAYGSVVIVPRELIDAAAAIGMHPEVALLCDPSRFERAAAIGVAIAERRLSLRDVNSEGAAPRLRQLSEEVGRIARTLAAMSGEDNGQGILPARDEPAMPANSGADTVIDAAQVRATIRARRLRDQYFPAELFADPAWDMLLDLMAAKLEGRQVAVSSLCIAAAVPPTTALRWIKTLTEQGIFVRIADPSDGRRVFIELSDQATAAMSNYLSAAHRLAIIAP